MATTRIVNQVQAGRSSEYYATLTPSTGDYLYMAFDGGINVDDLLIRSDSASFVCEVRIVYPSSGFTQEVESVTVSSGGEWSLNDGTNYATKWYQVPSGTNILFYFSLVTSSSKVECLVLGR